MSHPDGDVLVLGVGNILLQDEGVGIRIADEVAALDLPPGIRAVDGGTLGLDLLPLIEDAAALVMVDAVDLRAEPGTVDVLRGDELRSALGGHVSPHQVGVGDLIEVARLAGTLPDRVALVAIQPGTIAVGLELTPAVEAAVPRAVELAVAEATTARTDIAARAGNAMAPAGT